MRDAGASGLAPPRVLEQLIGAALSKRPVRWHKPHTGLSAAQRFVVGFADGSSVLGKTATDDETEAWLRTEHQVLLQVGTQFAPV